MESTVQGTTFEPGLIPMNEPDIFIPYSHQDNVMQEKSSGDELSTDSPSSKNTSGSSYSPDVEDEPQENILVEVNGSSQRERLRDKKQACLYCQKLVSQMARHLTDVHSEEQEVARALATDVQERRRILTTLRLKGNFYHNREVRERGTGNIIPVRRENKSKQDENREYLPCQYCLGEFKGSLLYKHSRVCSARKLSPSVHRERVKARSRKLLPVSRDAHKILHEKVFSTMLAGQTSVLARNDALIVSLGNDLISKLTSGSHRRNDVSSDIRLMATFVTEHSNLSREIPDLAACLIPAQFPAVIETVKRMSGYNVDTQLFQQPWKASKLSTLLKQCTDIRAAQFNIKGDLERLDETNRFRKLLDDRWKPLISTAAQTSKKLTKKPLPMPLKSDLELFTKKIKDEEQIRQEQLMKKPCETTWRALAEASLARVICFNKRRSGEAHRTKMTDFHFSISSNVQNDQVLDCLNEVEKGLGKTLTLVNIRGKGVRRVPILLTPIMRKSVDLLNQHRRTAGILESNPYTYALPGSEEAIRGWDAVNSFATTCGATYPKRLTAKNLRTHFATMTQLFALEENEVDQVATFMGHDLSTHRHNYRLQEGTIHQFLVSKLLLAMEGNNIKSNKGKSLREINPGQVDEQSREETDTKETNKEDTTARESENRKRQNEDAEWCEDEEGSNSDSETEQRPVKQKRKKAQRKEWTREEREAIGARFMNHIKRKTVPGKAECEAAKDAYPVLQDRAWKNIKDFVRYQFKK